MVKPEKWRLTYFFSSMLFFLFTTITSYGASVLNFSSKSSSFVLKDDSSNVTIGGSVTTRGWDGHSIIRDWNETQKPSLTSSNYNTADLDLVFSNSDAVTGVQDLSISNSEIILSNLSLIESNSAVVVSNVANIATNVSNISTNVSDISTNQDNIASNSAVLLSNLSLVESNSAVFVSNLDFIVSNSEAIVGLASGNSELIVTNSEIITDLSARVDTNETNISQNASDISGISQGVNPDMVSYMSSPKFSTSPTFTYNYFVKTGRKIIFDTSSTNLTVAGAGHTIEFATGDNNVIDISGGGYRYVDFQDIILKNFCSGSLNISADTFVRFGNGTRVEIQEHDLTLAHTLVFNGGTSHIQANGNKIDLTDNGIIVDDSTTLNIYNARIEGLGNSGVVADELVSTSWYETSNGGLTNNIYLGSSSSTLNLYNCDIVLADNFKVNQGTINIYEDVKVTGDYALTASYFTEHSGQIVIQSNSKLYMDRNTTLSCAANHQTLANMPVKFNSESSTLHLNSCTVDASCNKSGDGQGLTFGGNSFSPNLIIEDKVIVRGGPTADYPLIFDSDNLYMVVLNSGIIDFSEGYIDYSS